MISRRGFVGASLSISFVIGNEAEAKHGDYKDPLGPEDRFDRPPKEVGGREGNSPKESSKGKADLARAEATMQAQYDSFLNYGERFATGSSRGSAKQSYSDTMPGNDYLGTNYESYFREKQYEIREMMNRNERSYEYRKYIGGLNRTKQAMNTASGAVVFVTTSTPLPPQAKAIGYTIAGGLATGGFVAGLIEEITLTGGVLEGLASHLGKETKMQGTKGDFGGRLDGYIREYDKAHKEIFDYGGKLGREYDKKLKDPIQQRLP
jgi:hypothetical protein